MTLDLPLLGKLILLFILFTIVGTLSHEVGHFFASKLFGFTDGSIHYGSTSYGHSPASDSLNDYYKKRVQYQRKYHGDFPDEALLKKLEEPARIRHSIMAWGGPVQTMLTGTIGLIALLLIKRKKPPLSASLKPLEWFWVFVALFWLRQVANTFSMFMLLLVKGKYGRGDETYLSRHYDLPPWTLNVITGALAMWVLYYVVFGFVPAQQRFTFIVAGLVGGVSGYSLWLKFLGPIVLP